MSRFLFAVLAVAVSLTLACAPPRPEGDGFGCDDCNIVHISVDTLRADHLSLYGYDRPTSPYLETLAADGVVFDQHVNTGGGTLPVHMSMMTSLPPAVHNVLPKNERVLEEERVTLAETLAENGFVTGGFTDGGWMRGKFGFSQGFDSFYDKGGRLEKILPKALEWVETERDQRFYLFLHTYDVHSEWKSHPYSCPEGYSLRYDPDYTGEFDGCIGERCASRLFLWLNEQIIADPEFDVGEYLTEEDLRHQVARYDGCINYVDDKLEVLVRRLRELGLYDRTMIIVTSDHGEEFLDHGRLLHQNRPFEEMIRVPLIIKFPYSRFAGTRVEHLASTIDLMPTVLDVMGIPVPSQAMGESLLPTLTEDRPVRRAVHVNRTIRTQRWKLLASREGGDLFDLPNDPSESQNLSESEAELAARMGAESERVMGEYKRLFEDFQEGVISGETKVELTPEEIENLRALGYLD